MSNVSNEIDLLLSYHFTFSEKLSILDSIEGSICKEDLDLLKGWSFNVDENQKALLVPTGERELKGIGERFSKRLPSLLGNGYTKDKFKVIFSIHIIILKIRYP